MNANSSGQVEELLKSGYGNAATKKYREAIWKNLESDLSVEYFTAMLGSSKLFILKMMKCVAFLHRALLEIGKYNFLAGFLHRMFLPIYAVDVSKDYEEEMKSPNY